MNLRPLHSDQQQKEKPAVRASTYRPHEDFVGWVNKLGLEKTWLGRLAATLEHHLGLKKILLLFLFSLGLSFVINWDSDVSLSEYREGGIYVGDLKSPYSFDVLDQEETHRRRQEAENATPAVYDYDLSLYSQRAVAFRTAFRNLRDLTLKQLEFEQNLDGVRFSPETFQWLSSPKLVSGIDSVIAAHLEKWGDTKIVDDKVLFHQNVRSRVIINVLDGFTEDEFVQDADSILDTNEVRQRISDRTHFPFFVSQQDAQHIKEVLRSLVIPNLTFNRHETELRKSRASQSVTPFYIQVKKNQVIVRGGSPVQKNQMKIINEIKALQSRRHQDFIALLTAALFVALLFSYSSFTSRFMSKVKISTKDAVAMGAILTMSALLFKGLLYVANAALVDKFSTVPQSFYLYAFPASFGAMTVGLIIPFGEVVWLYAMFSSVVLGFMADKNFVFMLITFTSSIVAARGVYGCKKRNDLYWAGIKTGFVNTFLLFCVTLMSTPLPEDIKRSLVWNMSGGFASGLLACFFALTLIPFLESLFVYTTDVKLLELSNLNHPLLKELIVKAPGTYHHSLVVGSMCEAAAEAIGANPLLAKVSAYYHDIGKSDHALYFIENQKPGENRHDHVNPGMSKTILIAHVKDGVEKGLKYKLGREILDVIEQHHGTTLISYFYHKAKEMDDTTMHQTTEDEYRYPGPRPLTREAALCMLADSIEAAARSLDDPTAARLQNLTHNIIQRKFLDGQLNDCSLTLRDLTIIEDAFARILLSVYHQRIDYPTGPKAKKSTTSAS